MGRCALRLVKGSLEIVVSWWQPFRYARSGGMVCSETGCFHMCKTMMSCVGISVMCFRLKNVIRPVWGMA
jgi:hypothetical protein